MEALGRTFLEGLSRAPREWGRLILEARIVLL